MERDTFGIIQHFFTRMKCHHCASYFEPNGIELIREDQGVFLVNVFCHHCERQVGVAMVGVEKDSDRIYDASSRYKEFASAISSHPKHTTGRRFRVKDPELTPAERRRLSQFDPITDNDVLDAHHFIEGLGADWMKHLPEEMRQSQTVLQTESQES